MLFDGIGESIRDEFRVLFRPNQPAYIYVVGVDAVGRVQTLFPSEFPDRTNPVQAGERILIPGGESWYQLDRYIGLQHIYFYVSPVPDASLERQLAIFAAKPAPDPVGANGEIHYVSVPTILQFGRMQRRGIVTPVSGEIARLPDSAGLEIPTQLVAADVAGEPLVATRIFQHE